MPVIMSALPSCLYNGTRCLAGSASPIMLIDFNANLINNISTAFRAMHFGNAVEYCRRLQPHDSVAGMRLEKS